jgi:cytochrome c553
VDAGDLAAYFAGLKCQSVATSNEQATPAVPPAAIRCAACHSVDGRATNPAWPSLAGQSRDYLVGAIKAYKSGARSNALMEGIAKDLTDADAESAATYYAGAGCK